MNWPVFKSESHRAAVEELLRAIWRLAGDYARDCVKTVLVWWCIIMFVLPSLLGQPASNIPGLLALFALSAVVLSLAQFTFTLGWAVFQVWRQEREET